MDCAQASDHVPAVKIRLLPEDEVRRTVGGGAVLERAFERRETAHFLRIQTPHVTGPASLSVIGRPATLRASFI
jgi:hypothetical protein